MKSLSSTGTRPVKMRDGLLMYVCDFRLLYCNFICLFPLSFPESTGVFENKDRPGLAECRKLKEVSSLALG